MKFETHKKGFTLVELIIASSISLLVIGAGLTILITGIRSSALSTSVIQNDISQLGLDSKLTVDSRMANQLALYTEYSPGMTAIDFISNPGKYTGKYGNFLVLATSTSTNSGGISYKKISGLHYKNNNLYKFDYVVSIADQESNKPLTAILIENKNSIESSYKQQAKDLSPLSRSGLFLLRSNVSASMACIVKNGSTSSKTISSKVIEANFHIRK